MPSSDAFVVGNDFISEHFFNSDATNESFLKVVLARRKAWDDAEHPTSRKRFTERRGKLATDLASLYDEQGDPDADAAAKVTDDILGILGYRTGEFTTRTVGPVTWFNTPGVTADAPLAVVRARPAATVDDFLAKDADALALAEPWVVSESPAQTESTVSRAVSALFNADDAPTFVLVVAGRWLLLTEHSRWFEGRYLAVDLQTVADRNETKRGGEIDRALAILDADALAPNADGQVAWASVLEDAVKHTVGVSKDLREGVRRSIEIIANEVVARRKAAGLDPLPAGQAQPLAAQSLRFLYRILFLLYAEASPDLGVVPAGAPEYDAGYSVDRLRELTLKKLTSPKAQQGTHLYDSLDVLFRLIDRGHLPPAEASGQTTGLAFHALRADLFQPEAISLIAELKLGNAALQRVLELLLLSKERRGKKGPDRGFISYVDLGINQLGAVYEGLMSYTGFFATEDLYEVARGGNPEKGSWVVGVDRAQGIAETDFVTEEDPVTHERRPVIHRAGQFVYRLSGRARQQSASYYTPEVLTKFVVGQALEELLGPEDRTKERPFADQMELPPELSSEEILSLTVCEPALGSGAFAIEAVQQLAERYLSKRQAELGRTIDPEAYQAELQKVKAYLALHNVYGVDLNASAVEFAEITLWLATMARDLAAPWFGLHLRRGNSLIGARRAVYSRSAVDAKAHLSQPPTEIPLADLAARLDEGARGTDLAGRIYHFLLPADGWGSTADSKEARELAPDRVAAVKEWRKQFKTKLTKRDVDRLVALSERVDDLWTLALRRLTVADRESRRQISLWGRDVVEPASTVSREQIEHSLADADGAFQRLRLVMDAWCALWFWPLTGPQVTPPSFTAWILALEAILGVQPASGRRGYVLGQDALAPSDPWLALAEQESFTLAGCNAKPVADVLALHPWLRVAQEVSDAQGFFHWHLHFAPVFAKAGGFDLQVGNPPWVRPTSDVPALLAEGDPWWQLTDKPSVEDEETHRAIALAQRDLPDLVISADAAVTALGAYVGHPVNYPELQGLQPDLYRCFMATTWAHTSKRGMVGTLHPETHFTDEKAGGLRAATYPRLRRHWQFVNELQLFTEVHHLVVYGTHVYGTSREIDFKTASVLYHPMTIVRSYDHDGQGESPGFKHQGAWDQRPHKTRIQRVTSETLAAWRDVLDPELAQASETRMVYTVNREVAQTLEELAGGRRLSSLGLLFSAGWHEKNDRRLGYFTQRWGVPDAWRDVILQGPHLHVGTPLYKQPNPTMKHNQDWTETDFEALASDTVPATSYKPAGDLKRYDRDYTHWPNPDGGPAIAARDHYRLAWRMMAANTGERTLITAVIPPGTGHTHGVSAIAAFGAQTLCLVAGLTASLLADFAIRAAPKATIQLGSLDRLPVPDLAHPLVSALLMRTLRLNCMTDAYADLWASCWNADFRADSWTTDEHVFTDLGAVGPTWDASTPLRRAADRRQALVEIDALVALMLGVSADQLCTVYRTQFAVLYGYDHNEYTFDANGRIVPNPVLVAYRKKGDRITLEERTHTNQAGNTYVYDLPFVLYDREADMRRAYADFERRMAGKG